MSKEVAKKGTQEIAVSQDMDAWGGQTVTSNDIVIAKILPMQHMSEKVRNREADYGEFRDTLNNQKFGDLATPFEIIPFYMEKKWIEFSMIPQKNGTMKREFLRVTPIVEAGPDANDDWAYAEKLADGTQIERDRTMDFYVLIPGEIEEGGALPYVLSFRRTSLKAGKKIATQMFVKNRAAGKVPAAVVMEMFGKDVSNDDGQFVVQDAKSSRAATGEEVQAAFEWLKLVRGGQTRVDDTDLQEEAARSNRRAGDAVEAEVEPTDY